MWYRIYFKDFYTDFQGELTQKEVKMAIKKYHWAKYCTTDISVDDFWSDQELKKYKIIKIKPISSCYGCRNDSGGQMDHMEKGGCLYESSEND